MAALEPFGVRQTHGMLCLPTARVHASSDGCGWRSLFVSAQSEAPFEGVFDSLADQLLVLHRDGPAEVEALHDSGSCKGRSAVPAGGICILPAGARLGLRAMQAIETVHVYVRRAVIEEVAAECVGRDAARIEIAPGMASSDRCLRGMIETAADALGCAAGAELFSDYLARAIAAHLIRSHSGLSLRSGTARCGLGDSPAMSAAVEFMNDNIDQSISLDDIARATNRSPSYVVRMFRNQVGVPPHRYLIGLRVDKARQLLKDTSIPIAEIAFECGFAHQEHLTRLFRRQFAATPAAYRRSMHN